MEFIMELVHGNLTYIETFNTIFMSDVIHRTNFTYGSSN